MMKRLTFSLLKIIGISSLLRFQKKNTLTVLSLHRVSNDKDYFWNPITPGTFEKLLQYVTKYYSVTSFENISQLKENHYSSKPYLILSFDDGYYDFYEHALPLLRKYNLASNHNIVNDCATHNQIIWTQRLNAIFNYCKENRIDLSFLFNGKKISFQSHNGNWLKFYLEMYNLLLKISKVERLEILAEKEQEYSISPVCKMMNWEQVIECSESQVEIGCHTYAHDVLSTITDASILHKEIIQSAIEIEKKVGKKCKVLALPNGEGNEKIEEIVESSGLKYVLYVDDKINNFSHLKGNSMKDIYRINLVEESIVEMIFRIELFHTKIRKYV
ncbi:MAG: polysaccharide deacetylase family protein [Ginsengibacter sp.]